MPSTGMNSRDSGNCAGAARVDNDNPVQTRKRGADPEFGSSNGDSRTIESTPKLLRLQEGNGSEGSAEMDEDGDVSERAPTEDESDPETILSICSPYEHNGIKRVHRDHYWIRRSALKKHNEIPELGKDSKGQQDKVKKEKAAMIEHWLEGCDADDES